MTTPAWTGAVVKRWDQERQIGRNWRRRTRSGYRMPPCTERFVRGDKRSDMQDGGVTIEDRGKVRMER
jgi:hypothetical protein